MPKAKFLVGSGGIAPPEQDLQTKFSREGEVGLQPAQPSPIRRMNNNEE